MNSKSLLLAGGLLTAFAGCATAPVTVRRAPVKADAHFTIPYVDVSKVDVPPKLVRMDHPAYHLSLPANGSGEFAVVQFVIDANGVPRQVQWVQASDLGFARAAARSAAESRYQPALKDGKAVAAKVELHFAVNYAVSWSNYYTAFGGHDFQANGMQNRYDAQGIFVNNYGP